MLERSATGDATDPDFNDDSRRQMRYLSAFSAKPWIDRVIEDLNKPQPGMPADSTPPALGEKELIALFTRWEKVALDVEGHSGGQKVNRIDTLQEAWAAAEGDADERKVALLRSDRPGQSGQGQRGRTAERGRSRQQGGRTERRERTGSAGARERQSYGRRSESKHDFRRTTGELEKRDRGARRGRSQPPRKRPRIPRPTFANVNRGPVNRAEAWPAGWECPVCAKDGEKGCAGVCTNCYRHHPGGAAKCKFRGGGAHKEHMRQFPNDTKYLNVPYREPDDACILCGKMHAELDCPDDIWIRLRWSAIGWVIDKIATTRECGRIDTAGCQPRHTRP